jgi:hypothetical protein
MIKQIFIKPVSKYKSSFNNNTRIAITAFYFKLSKIICATSIATKCSTFPHNGHFLSVCSYCTRGKEIIALGVVTSRGTLAACQIMCSVKAVLVFSCVNRSILLTFQNYSFVFFPKRRAALRET